MRFVCTSCGAFIVQKAFSDPYMCRDCERMLEGLDVEEHYEKYLENY